MSLKLKIKSLIWRTELFIYTRLDPRGIVNIGLTNFCQCSCVHCAMADYPKNKQKELSKKELLRIIEQFSRKRIRTIYFFGGEPLLRDDIFDLISFAKQKGFRTVLDTNGLLLNQEVTKKLKDVGLDMAEISIDSSFPRIHNNLRGVENAFEKTISGVKNCMKEKIQCCLSICATKENIKNGDLEKMLLLGEKLGVRAARIITPLALGKWKEKQGISLTCEQKKILKKICYSSLGWIENENCLVMSRKVFYISPYGEVQPCPYLPFSFGNLRKNSLKNILKNMWNHSMFKTGLKHKCPVNEENFRKKYFSKINSSVSLPISL